MQQNDDVVSDWLDGADGSGGLDNPAGPLYVDSTVEKKMTSQAGPTIQTMLKTTQSCASGCACC